MIDEEHLCFYDQTFLQFNPLNSSTIIDYFSTSQFYNRNCINEILKMQSQFANIDIADNLTKTPGFYYILEREAENLFIIAKKEFDGIKTDIVTLYYCIYGHIYRAPTAKAVSEARLINGLWCLNEALDKCEDQKKFDWLKGFKFRNKALNRKDDEKESRFIMEALHDFELYKSKK